MNYVDCNGSTAAVDPLVIGTLSRRPPMQATSGLLKPAATMNTVGAMMVGSNQSKDAMNDGKQSLFCMCTSVTNWVLPSQATGMATN